MAMSGWLFNYHFAVFAVKVQGEFLSVVEQGKVAGLLCSLVYRTKTELVSYAVSGTHKFGVFPVSKLVCRFCFLESGILVELV